MHLDTHVRAAQVGGIRVDQRVGAAHPAHGCLLCAQPAPQHAGMLIGCSLEVDGRMPANVPLVRLGEAGSPAGVPHDASRYFYCHNVQSQQPQRALRLSPCLSHAGLTWHAAAAPGRPPRCPARQAASLSPPVLPLRARARPINPGAAASPPAARHIALLPAHHPPPPAHRSSRYLGVYGLRFLP